jgi:hypothetical protein
MAGDVGAFAGTTADLAFLCEATQGGLFPLNENIFNLDNIQFSAQSVPEPSALSLFGIGIIFVGWCLTKQPNRDGRES